MNTIFKPPTHMPATLYSSEAFAEDLQDDSGHDGSPWTLPQAGLAALLCLVPVGLAFIGSVTTLWGAA